MKARGLEVLLEVFKVLEDRRDLPVTNSYVSNLMARGLDAILYKVSEEARELEGAARGEGDVVHEATDLIFHVMVLLAFKGVPLSRILDEFGRRRKRDRGSHV